MRKSYKVEMLWPGGWRIVSETDGVGREFALGYLAGVTSFYPSPAHRVVEIGTNKVIQLALGHGTPHTN